MKMNQMKCSQSMSSLESSQNQGQKILRTPEGTLKKPRENDRLCHTLSSKKPRRSLQEKQMVRRSWGFYEEMEVPMDENDEEFYSLLQNTPVAIKYQEKTTEVAKLEISRRQFLEDYTKICDWLNSVQVQRGQSADEGILMQLGTELLQRQPWRIEINESAKSLVERLPHLKEECAWRIRHLNSQWDALEKILLCQSPTSQDPEIKTDNGSTTGIEWLKQWLNEMENQLQPLDFKTKWTHDLLQLQIVRHKELQSEIEEKSGKVHEALRKFGAKEAAKKGRLEKRWWQLRLRVLEWVQHLSGIQDRLTLDRGNSRTKPNANYYSREAVSSDEESRGPLPKYRRIGIQEREEDSGSGSDHLSVQEVPSGSFEPSAFQLDEDVIMGHTQETQGTKGRIPSSNSIVEFVIFQEDGEKVQKSGESLGMKMSGSTSSINSSSGASSCSSSSLKRKLTYFDKFDASNYVEDVLEEPLNVSTYYFKHSDSEHVKKCEVNCESSEEPHLDAGQAITSEEKDSQVGNTAQSLSPLSPQPDEMASSEPKPVVPLEKEIGELVQKAEELARRSAKKKFELDNIFAFTGSFDEESGQSATERLRHLRKSSSSSFASLKAKFSAVEEALLETSSKGHNAKEQQCGMQRKLRRKGSSRRVRQWVKENGKMGGSVDHLLAKGKKKTPSSCDASAESTTDSEGSEISSLSDDPTTTTLSTLLPHTQAALTALNKRTSSNSSSQGGPSIPLRNKLSGRRGKQRPKSFTETGTGVGPYAVWGSGQGCFISSDTALNLLGNEEEAEALLSRKYAESSPPSGSGSESVSDSNPEEKGKADVSSRSSKSLFRERVARKRLFRQKRKSTNDLVEEVGVGGVVRSVSFIETGPVADSQPEEKENSPRPMFQISGPVSSTRSPVLPQSDVGSSMNTEQDWDSYQEKYLSEPYSEEAYDPNDTLKLLAFGEDYGQYLDRPDSESSSILSGFEPQNPRRRRPLVMSNRQPHPESDSDLDELHHLLSQSSSQLKLMETLFKKELNSSSPSKLAQIQATCAENVGSLQQVLSRSSEVPLSLDVMNVVEGLLGHWSLLLEKVKEASQLSQLREEMEEMRSDFSSVQSHFVDVDPFDASDLQSLHGKIGQIQRMLKELGDRKLKLQSLNEASLGSQLFLSDTGAGGLIKEQLQELYALYEENFQLGSFLLDRMRFLQDAWEKFEAEKSEFERSISVGSLRSRLKRELGSSAASDSGHGTDVSHDSSVDSDLEFQEKREKLAALKKRAIEIKAFLPPGSPVMDVIEQRVHEAEKGLEDLRKCSSGLPEPNLKIIYPKSSRKSPVLSHKRSSSVCSKREPLFSSKRRTMSSPSLAIKPGRRWRVVRRMIAFNFALMGMFFAAAYFLHPNCCEYSNTFCLSLVPHLTHESLPPI